MATSKRPKDINERAKLLVDILTGDKESLDKKKDAAAVSLGRRGGLKGGVARAKKLSAKRRKEIAKKAAKKRWSKK
ncbi:MAG TPA: hypothetical protein VN922_12770 [Bacteroidia bacterium]|nr:hypothetical protein [Bacteroidia bacterium]